MSGLLFRFGPTLIVESTNYNSKSDQFSQELQALVDTERLDGVLGLYYFDENSFDRLLALVDRAVGEGVLPGPVIAQTGSSSYQPENFEAQEMLDAVATAGVDITDGERGRDSSNPHQFP